MASRDMARRCQLARSQAAAVDFLAIHARLIAAPASPAPSLERSCPPEGVPHDTSAGCTADCSRLFLRRACRSTRLTSARQPTGTSAADWPEWRGNHRDGISTDRGSARQWPAGGPAAGLEGQAGWAADFPASSIARGRIFTMGDREDGQFVIALNLADGKELWSTRIGDVWEPQGYSGPALHARPSTAILVYVIGPHGDLVCLAAETRQGNLASQPAHRFRRQHALALGL